MLDSFKRFQAASNKMILKAASRKFYLENSHLKSGISNGDILKPIGTLTPQHLQRL
jgi:hypothetical protein